MIWLIGNKGMLGSEVDVVLKSKGEDYIATDKEVDITNYLNIEEFAEGMDISWIINCSAYTAVDTAEEEPEKAFSVNAKGVDNIVKIAAKKGASLIHISTDYVFDGKKDGEFLEDDETAPLSVYGKSKLEGEKSIQKKMEKYFIIRTAWLYGRYGKNFVKTMLRLFNQQSVVRVVNDQYGNPTFVRDLAGGIMHLLSRRNNNWGIYHFTNRGRTTWFDFAREIYKLAKRYNIVNREVEIMPISSVDFPARASRPVNSTLSTDKFENTFGFRIRKWEEALNDFFEELSRCNFKMEF